MNAKRLIRLLMFCFLLCLGIKALLQGPEEKPFVGPVSLLTISGYVLLFFSSVGLLAFMYNLLKRNQSN